MHKKVLWLAPLAIIVIVIIFVIALTGSLHKTTFTYEVTYDNITEIPVWGVSLPLDNQEACTVAKQTFVKMFPESTSRNTFDCDDVNMTLFPGSQTRRIWWVVDCSIQIYEPNLYEWKNASTAIGLDELNKQVHAVMVPLGSEFKDFQLKVCANKTKT
jgi:hypothetical protein